MARFSRISILSAVVVAFLATAAAACVAAAAAGSAWASVPVATAHPATAPASAATKLVRYRGYSIRVPAAWPVYDLSTHPSVCVRFDRHAVYLGSPSPTQRCPAHAAGRTEAILVSPLVARSALAGGAGGGPALAPVRNAGAQPPFGASAQLAIPARGIAVTTTWGRDPALIEHALRLGHGRLLRAARSPGAKVARGRANRPAARSRHSSPGGGAYTGLGFDACSAPTGSQMTAWSRASPYHAVGIYVGGTNMACSQPNLTSSWVSAEAAAGWYVVPIYVGLQSPSSSCGCSTIAPKQAASQGTAAALDAVAQAQAVGLGTGTPIYFDMEAYTPGGKSTNAVLTFLAAWTTQLHASGYVSGVYSSGASGIADLVASYGTNYLEPDDIWIADWNGAKTTSDPFVPAADWANHQRLHQYSGGHNETYAHVTINVDGNYLDVQASGTWAPPPDGTYVQVAGTSPIYRLAGGAPLYVSNWTAVGGPQSVMQLTAQQFSLLRPVPLGGTFLQTSTGGIYRVAGGAPLWVSSWNVFDVLGVQPPYVAIDQWDIDNITNPMAHLRTYPTNGTWLTTPTGQIYRVAGGTPFSIASWTPYGGVKPSVTIDPWELQNISSPQSHLLASPVDGTVVEGLPSLTYWMFKGGKRQQINPTRGAVKVDDAALAPFRIIVTCVVPKLQNLTLGQARRRLHRSHCRLGKVTTPIGTARALRIIRQWPRAHTRRQRGYAVKVTLA